MLLELPLASQVYTHPSRDLALLKLADSDAIASWQAAAKEFQVQTLALDTAPCEQGDDVVFLGHRQVNKELEEGYQVPMTVAGHFVGRSSGGQVFARSQELLEEGMCGGAVIRATTHECVGIVEGIVPMSTGEDDQEPPRHDRNAHEVWQMRRALAGHVALIPSHDVEEFMNDPGNLLLTGMEVPQFM
uniref:Uncharacterized protein n=2 Tax=Hyaloperonospora arabidopsidis (strain Emoy2) TaxID=559515 RepID=M4BSU8_HYAAE